MQDMKSLEVNGMGRHEVLGDGLQRELTTSTAIRAQHAPCHASLHATGTCIDSMKHSLAEPNHARHLLQTAEYTQKERVGLCEACKPSCSFLLGEGGTRGRMQKEHAWRAGVGH